MIGLVRKSHATPTAVRDAIVDDYRSGLPLRAIAEAYGCSLETIRRFCRAKGTDRRRAGVSFRRRWTEALDLYMAGATVSTIATLFGVAEDTVRRSVRRAGLPPRERWPHIASQRDAIVEAYRRGDKGAAIAATFGVTEKTIRRLVRAAGHPIRKPGWPAPIEPDRIERIGALWRAGVKRMAIAHECGVSEGTVQKYARRRGWVHGVEASAAREVA